MKPPSEVAREILPCCDGTMQCVGCEDCSSPLDCASVYDAVERAIAADREALLREVLSQRCEPGSHGMYVPVAAIERIRRRLNTDSDRKTGTRSNASK